MPGDKPLSECRLLLVSPLDPASPAGGRAMLSRMNDVILSDLLDDRLVRYRPIRTRAPSPIDVVRGHIDGIDPSTIHTVDALIRAERIDLLFLDGSNLGALAGAIRLRHPGIRILTFLHNVEARFFLAALRARPGLRALAVLAANYRAERAAVRASDVLIALSPRDCALLRQLYGRGADAVAPLAIQDRPPSADDPAFSHPFALFVGGGFYGNIEGVRWFARHVSPATTTHTVILGHGMDVLTQELAEVPNVHVVGAVDDLAPWYGAAHVVVAPILSGSGMKTKVAEALMYGKRVIGLPEAFVGYDDAVVDAGWRCENAAAFVGAMHKAFTMPLPRCDPTLRALYESHYSFAAARARMADIL